MSDAARPRRVAVLGGGLAGLVAAYEIASRDPEARITVYQVGWRLGGKVASSRNTPALRIEEHGIHILFGAYENLFHVVRRAYQDLGLRWQDAFEERHEFTLMESVGPRWVPWTVSLPRADGDPGDSLVTGNLGKEAPALIADLIGWLRDRVSDYFAGTPIERPAQWFFGGSVERSRQSAERVRDALAAGAGATPRGAARVQRALLWRLRWNLLLLRIVGWIGHILWLLLRPFLGDALQRSDNVRRLWIAAELGVACAAGLTNAAMNGTTRLQLDDDDLRHWLSQEGVFGGRLSPTTSQSAPLRMVYEVVFAYEQGDPARPALAAGTGMRDLLRLLFDRHGALAYLMRAGSAETLITPLYRALRQRNVRFEFFHRVDRLEVAEDGTRIARVHMTRQARPLADAYDPLIADGAWPEQPKYELLDDGQRLARAAEAFGERALEMPDFAPPTAAARVITHGGTAVGDFDEVVLAIPVGPQRQICAELARRDQRWQQMLDRLPTVATQSVQLWFDRSAAELGWTAPGAKQPMILGGYAQPLGNWVDLSLTLAHEGWAHLGGQPPRSVAYLCGPLADADAQVRDPGGQRRQSQSTCLSWLRTHGQRLWPTAFAGDLDWERLVTAAPQRGQQRYEAQYFRLNINPSDRYTLSLPGTTGARLTTDQSGFANLHLAGDWTRNGFDVGCAEATVMSGRQAARAVLGVRPAAMPVYGENG